MSDNDNVPYREEVTRGELPHALRGYNALGYPPAGYVPGHGGMIAIIIMAPPQAQIPDWRSGAFAQTPPHRGRSTGGGLPADVRVAAAVLVLAGVGYLAYAFMGGRAVFPASVPDGYRVLWGNIIDGIGVMVGIAIFMTAAWLGRQFGPRLAAMLGRGGK